jgi:hypothetical protein
VSHKFLESFVVGAVDAIIRLLSNAHRLTILKEFDAGAHMYNFQATSST